MAKKKKLYDVYFMPTQPMVICVEAESEEEAKRLVAEDDGTLISREEALMRFGNALGWNEEWEVTDIVYLDDAE